jgi:hypothetical protein
MKPLQRPAARRALALIAAALAVLGLAACEPKLPAGIDKEAMDDAVGQAIGSPSTCVLVAEASGKLVYRYGSHTTCARSINACDRPGTTTLKVQLDAARRGVTRTASCATAAADSRGVAWASGPLPDLAGKPPRHMAYAAFMEDKNALSGREAKIRLEHAFEKMGL